MVKRPDYEYRKIENLCTKYILKSIGKCHK